MGDESELASVLLGVRRGHSDLKCGVRYILESGLGMGGGRYAGEKDSSLRDFVGRNLCWFIINM